MTRMIDISGMIFCRWTVLREDGRDKRGEVLWRCRCKCGNESRITSSSLRSGNSRSCGCILKDHPPKKTHGASNTKLYQVWKGMIRRCENKNTRHYNDYGGRGISVCERWRHSFENFINDMGPRPEGYSIERKDNNGNYEPLNCIWASSKDQNNNTRNNRVIIIGGEQKTMTQWSTIYGISASTIWKRIKLGWSDEDSVLTPVNTILL